MTPIRLGLRENLAQFSLLVVVNAFVGAMVGMERSILPPIAEQEFHLAAKTAVLSFIVVFGVTKALTNYLAGRLSDRFGRKHVLVAGWLVAVPVPFLLMWAPTLDLGARRQRAARRQPGPHLVDDGDHEDRPRRPEASAGWRWASTSSPATSRSPAARSRPATSPPATACGREPFYLGVGVRRGRARCCRCCSCARPRTTSRTSRRCTATLAADDADASARSSGARRCADRNLSSVSQAGLVNNLNDGMAWGLFPLFFAAAGMNLEQIGMLAAHLPGDLGRRPARSPARCPTASAASG